MERILLVLLVSIFAGTQAQISKVQDVKTFPVLYEESTAVTLSWQPPNNLGGNQIGDLLYNVQSCSIGTTNCASYGNTSSTNQTMKGFDRSRNQYYTYHITVYGKADTKSTTTIDLINFQKRDTCRDGFFTCDKVNQCLNATRICDGLQGCSDNSDETSFADCKPPTAPDVVTFDKITETSVEVKYEQLEQKHRVTSYQIEVKVENSVAGVITRVSHQRFTAPAKSKVIDGLKSGTTYRVRINAINSVGPGDWSLAKDFKTAGVASTPLGKITNVNFTPKPLQETSAVLVTWNPPAGTSGEVKNYHVSYCVINHKDTCKNTTTTEEKFLIEGLDKKLFYTLHINAINSKDEIGVEYNRTFSTLKKRTCGSEYYTCKIVDNCVFQNRTCNGRSDCTDHSDETADAKCSLPIDTATKISIVMLKTTGFTVKFTQVHMRNRVTKYDIEVEEIATKTAFIKKKNHSPLGIPDVSVKIDGLKIESEYRIRVRANNRVGNGPWTEYVTATTETFGPVLNVKLTPVEFKESSSLTMSWEPPHGVDSSKYMYQVKYCRVNLEDTCKTTPKSSDTSVVISGILRADIIEWKVMVFAEDMTPGKSIKDTYKTQQRNKCTTDEFRCTASPQCISQNNTCNIMVDCEDSSDEKTAAGCKTPTSLPTNIKSKKTNDGSFEFTFIKLASSNRIKGYNVQVRDIINDEVVYTNFKNHNYAALHVVTFVIEGLTQGRKYEVRFQGVNPSGDGPWSLPLQFSTIDTDDKTTTTTTTTAKPAESDSSSSGMTTAQKAGVAVGIILGLVVIVLIIVILLKQRNKKKGAAYNSNKYAANGAKANNGGYEMDRKQ